MCVCVCRLMEHSFVTCRKTFSASSLNQTYWYGHYSDDIIDLGPQSHMLKPCSFSHSSIFYIERVAKRIAAKNDPYSQISLTAVERERAIWLLHLGYALPACYWSVIPMWIQKFQPFLPHAHHAPMEANHCYHLHETYNLHVILKDTFWQLKYTEICKKK